MTDLYVCAAKTRRDNMGRQVQGYDDIVVFTNRVQVADFLDHRTDWELRVLTPGRGWYGDDFLEGDV